MKKALIAIACVLLWRTAAFGRPQQQTDTAAKPEDSALVKAAKASGGKRKPKSKVITNADVKKSGGKLTELPGSKASITLKTSDPQNPLKMQAEQRRAADEAAKRVALAETKVAHLESDVASLEQSYYESNDPNDRDTSIKRQFDLKKQQLDAARKELAEARQAQAKLSPSTRAQ